ncbi:MAG: HDOD domain-containing protein [Gammaproteobacteria bacterium]
MPYLSQNQPARLRDLPHLPPLPTTGRMVLAELSREEVEIERLAQVIEQDPGLTARIIGMANSAFYGCSDRIFTVADAIVKVLGLNLVRSLAFSIVMSGPLSTRDCPGFRLDEYWYLAMVTANLARRLSHDAPEAEPGLEDNAHLCGLLHNFGLLVMVHCFPEQMAPLCAEPQLADAVLMAPQEEQRVGLTRADVGAILGHRWHIPEAAVAVMEHHADPAYRGRYWQPVVLVGLAARLASRDFHRQERDLEPDVLAALGLPEDAVAAACEALTSQEEQIRSAARVLSPD